jgi:hypothetical protein
MKDMVFIRLQLPKDLKKEFVKACDGRTMTHVLIKLIEKYVEDSKGASTDERH